MVDKLIVAEADLRNRVCAIQADKKLRPIGRKRELIGVAADKELAGNIVRNRINANYGVAVTSADEPGIDA